MYDFCRGAWQIKIFLFNRKREKVIKLISYLVTKLSKRGTKKKMKSAVTMPPQSDI
jgi:hypothetical protein